MNILSLFLLQAVLCTIPPHSHTLHLSDTICSHHDGYNGFPHDICLLHIRRAHIEHTTVSLAVEST